MIIVMDERGKSVPGCFTDFRDFIISSITERKDGPMRVLGIFVLAAILLFGMGASASFAGGDDDRDRVFRGERGFFDRDFDRNFDRNRFLNRDRFFVRDRFDKFDKEEFDDDFFDPLLFFLRD
jgi:hypothetical protein